MLKSLNQTRERNIFGRDFFLLWGINYCWRYRVGQIGIIKRIVMMDFSRFEMVFKGWQVITVSGTALGLATSQVE